MPQLQIPKKLQPLLRPKQIKVVYGGRGSAKSQTFADLMLMQVETQRHKVGCFRELQNSIKDSVHSLLVDEYQRMELSLYSHTETAIKHKHGGEFIFKGLSRNPDAVKSTHGLTRSWVEEAQSVSDDSLKQLIPTIREKGSELWFSMNPMSSADPMSKRFLKPFEKELTKNGYYEDDMHMIIECNYMDNPFFPEELDNLRLWDYENLSRAEYDHIWMGKYNDTVENALIKAEWFDACIDAHVKLGFKPKGQIITTHDPSDGGDPQATATRHGNVITDVQENDRDDVNDGCDWACNIAIQHASDVYRWDGDGLGISLKRQVEDNFKGKKTTINIFRGSEAPNRPNEIYQAEDGDSRFTGRTNDDIFKNKRAQCYWALRDRIYTTYRAVVKKEYIDPERLISISSDIENMEKLRSEVCRIPVKPLGSGLIQIMSKEEMKNKHKIESPNLADSLMMSMDYGAKINKDFLKPLKPKRGFIV